MNYKQLKALDKVCNKKATPGTGQYSPTFWLDSCIATDSYALVYVTGETISELCNGCEEPPRQVPNVLIDGFAAAQEVKADDVSVDVSFPVNPKTARGFVEMDTDENPVICDTKLLRKVLAIFDAFKIDPVIRCIENAEGQGFVQLFGYNSNYEIKACIAGKRKC